MNLSVHLFKKIIKHRIDDRLDLLLSKQYFTDVIGTISSRESNDAASVILQAMLAVLMRPMFAQKTYCADLIVYAISPYEEERLSDLHSLRDILNKNEIEGILMWLREILDMDFAKLCNDEVLKAISYWEKQGDVPQIVKTD